MSTTTQLRKPKTTTAAAPVTTYPLKDGKGFPTNGTSTKGAKQYTWEEIAQHNTEQSAWVYRNNRVYDITPWLNSHPGGKQILLLVAGRDITDLLTTYHPFSSKPEQILNKYEIGEIAIAEFPQYTPDTGFYSECRQAVGNYFKEKNLNPKDPLPGLMRLAGFFSMAALGYAICVGNYSIYLKMIAAVIFGVCQALPLLHCMHDASHLAIGVSETWWTCIGRLCMDWFAGACLYSWHNQHVIGHHVYTNVHGVDPDVPLKSTGDIRRITPEQTWLPYYQWQHLYLLVLYGSLGIKFRIQDITDTLIDNSNGVLRVNSRGAKEIIGQVITKSFWAFWRIYLPLYYFNVPTGQFWGLFLISELVTGWYLAFNFQVSHVSPDCEFPSINKPIDSEWAVSQVQTSVDYAHNSPISTLLCGALNYQTIHHLFPGVSQYYYPHLAPIIMKIAKKYNVRYNYVGSFTDAFKLHYQHLKNMGMNVELHMH